MILLPENWRPVLICSLLLAFKVSCDKTIQNVDFNNLFPQFPTTSINSLEKLFLQHIQWNTYNPFIFSYISRKIYTQYYFGLRSLHNNSDIRRKYITSFVNPPNSDFIEVLSYLIFRLRQFKFRK